jgi:opacity protein-like surface antigen
LPDNLGHSKSRCRAFALINHQEFLLKKSLIAAALLAACSFSAASAAPMDVGMTVGTLGYGPQAGWIIAPNQFDARLNAGTLSKSYSTTSNGVDYNGHLKLANVGLLGDWHPWGGDFRLTGGLFYNDNRFDLTAQPAGGVYTFGGATYTAAQAGTVTAHVDFNNAEPYIGLGWGDGGDGPGLHFTSDFGVIYQGSPRVHLTATGAAANPALASSLQAEQSQLQSNLNAMNSPTAKRMAL